MKNLYFLLSFFSFSLFVSAQTSSEVGITEGQLSVSSSGGANYTIPIAVPPGINGVVPQISLSYNSQGGNGVAGYGWNISGVSTITRIPATKFHDNAVGAVGFTTQDRFAFNGQRLMVKSGTSGAYGASGTLYETESFSTIKITSYGVHRNGANYGPAYFIVEYPDGSKAYYGNSGDSCSLTDWAITYWENPQGVRISYSYNVSNNSLSIASINYGAIQAASPINHINFIYDKKQRPEQAFVGGQSIIKNTILKEIKVVGNEIGFRNYSLNYESTTLGYQKLTGITEKNGDSSKSYNPTIFEYNKALNNAGLKVKNAGTIDMSGVDYSNTEYVSGDFDGDGQLDLILYPKTGDNKKKEYSLYTNITAQELNFSNRQSVGAFEEIFPISYLSSDNKLMPSQAWVVVKENSFTTYIKGSTGILPVDQKQYTFPKFTRYYFYPCGGAEPMLQATQTKNTNSNLTANPPKYKDGSVEKDIPKVYISGDFNGDGLTEVVVIEKPFSYYVNNGCVTTIEQKYAGGKTYLVNLDRKLTSNFLNQSGFLDVTIESKFIVADFNGDGKSDIYVFDKGKVSVYELDHNNQFKLLFTKTDEGIVLDRQLLMGDYNGDGKMDFVIPNELNKDSWNFYFSTGTTFNKVNTAIGLAYYTSYTGAFGVVGFPTATYSINDVTFIANDFNGDGKTDILYQQNLTVNYIMTDSGSADFRRKGESQITKLVLLENMGSTGNAISFNLLNKQSQLAGIKRDAIPIFVNHNQVNQNLEYSLISGNAIKSFTNPKDNREDVLVRKIITGNKAEETITYESLKYKYNKVYSGSPYIENYPNLDVLVAPGFQVVSKLEKKSATVFKKQSFSYYGAVSNVEGLGFLGFRSTVRTNWYDSDNTIISSISKNDIALRGANTENYTALGLYDPLRVSDTQTASTIVKEGNYIVQDTDNLVATQSIILKPDTWIKPGSTFLEKINEEANTSSNAPLDYIAKSRLNYETELLPNKVFKIKNTSTKQYNGLDNTSSETYVEYDAANNPLKSVTLLKESGTTVQTTVSNVSYNPATASPYVIGRPSGKNQSVTISGDVITTEEVYFYKNSLLTQIKKKGTNTDYIVEDNDYDAFGNITRKTITAAGLPARVTSYGYDPTGRFLTTSTDIEGLTTSFVYNPDSTLKSEINPYGLTTSYLYDSWFKKTATIDYLGKKNEYFYTRSGIYTIVTSTADDGSVSQETFDDLGRKIRAGSKNIMGTFAYVDYVYDIQDRNYKVSEPYFGSVGTQWNETKYDVYGRVIQSIAFTGKRTDITYSGLTSTVNDGTKSKTAIKNAIGNVVSLTDTPGGTIRYTYFANGNLKESEYAGVKTTIKQDGWGRKTELKDSSAGTYTYAYNAFGETTTETTPNGTTTYTLDAVGKLTQKTINGTLTNSATTYDYDATSKLLSGSTFTDFNNERSRIVNLFTYDASKRISKTVETTPYAQFTKEYKYDGFGRVDTETSIAAAGGKSSSKTIKNTYKNGVHWQLLDNATSAILWQTNTINARGQLTNAQAGPTSVTNVYDAYGLASQIKYDKTAGSANILTLNTVFDAKKGNLTSRGNSLFGRNESFMYDAQDRLTEFTNAQGVQEKQLYDDQGRITQNSLGTYSYSKEKPYQNQAIALLPESLSYYTAKPRQIITYNAFKSPVQIEDKDIDKISFLYNDDNSRTAMFYGGLQEKIVERPLKKYYSADGSMEIKENTTTGAVEFITFIGGDGYIAPIVFRSNNTTQDYLYLQRDYQGSILTITNQAGNVLEKRLFDAWGAIVRVQDGAGNVLAGLTILDRGYTGHEHLQSVGLINMNGRIYDPKLHRFLQPDNFVQDPSNTQNFNRYGYCYNNPLKYTDPSGEFVWAPILVGALIGAIIGGTSYVVQAAMTGNWNWGQFGVSVLGGAVIGGISGGLNPASLMGSSVGGALGTGFVAAFLPAYGVQVGDWSFNISPSIAFGNVTGIGASISVTYSNGDFSFSAGVGIMSNSNYNGFGKNGLEIRKSILVAYDDGKTGVSLGTNFWTGNGGMEEFKQQTGVLGIHSGDFKFSYENDGAPFQNKKFFGGIYGDGADRYRTAAAAISIGRFSAGFNLFTGSRTSYKGDNDKIGNMSIGNYGERMPNGFVNEDGPRYRMGAAYFSYGNYRVGINSDRYIRHGIQDHFAHNWIGEKQPGFESVSNSISPYLQYRTTNIFTSW